LRMMRLDAPNARATAPRLDQHLVVSKQRAAGRRARDDGPRALRGEHAVDPKARAADVTRRRRSGQDLVEHRSHIRDTASAHGVDDDHRPWKTLLDLEARQLDGVAVDGI